MQSQTAAPAPRYDGASILVPGDRALRGILGELHGDCADVVLIVAGLHAAAALAHHYLLRDRVLRRMLP